MYQTHLPKSLYDFTILNENEITSRKYAMYSLPRAELYIQNLA